MGVIGKDIPHDSARGHVTGQSLFIDDMPFARNELLVDFVGSPVAHGVIESLDLQAAREVDGVVALLTAKDVPGHNTFGAVVKDEQLLVGDTAVFLGQPVVLIAATSQPALRAAKKAIRLTMRPLPPIFSIDDAIAANSFLGGERVIARGNVTTALASSRHVLEGSLVVGGQEHFYLESQAAVAFPGEHGAITIHSSTQHPTEVQSLVAEVLGVPFNHVTCIAKRMGGAFGGKETQAAQPAMMAALVAARTGRPARIVYNKDDDMRTTGKRHPFKSWYTVGFDDDGLITALDLKLFSNGGCSTDLSLAVLERAMLHSDNAYYLPNVRITGRVCRTNLPSNTAFRGFGGPQGVVNIENIVEEVALSLAMDALEVRRRNCYGTGTRNSTPYGQRVQNNTLPRIFEKLSVDADYFQRRREIDTFNATSKTHLRGLSMTPVKFGISFTKKTLNQANALVNIYTDGTVMVSTGATEMGQGVHTRVRQIVADELGIAYDAVIVGATSTDKNHNTSPTAASSGTDLNGAAARDACCKLRARLAEFAARELADAAAGLDFSREHVQFQDGMVFDTRDPSRRMRFAELICRAYIQRVNLGERGFYATPGVDFNRETGKGHPFLYFTNGAACSEILIDRFTGEMTVTRVDLLMDAGQCINPGIDRGQVVGGFVQGMGWVTTEELKYDDAGVLLSHSPTTYKIPAISDVPRVFNVEFLDNPDNAVSLYRSKALGEPPLLLGISVWTAAKDALSYAGSRQIPRLQLPATVEQILTALTRQTGPAAPSTQPAIRAEIG
ncbi:MAG TPA: xanthine dehydrogenase molybdopterin binding subunit [Tepidisphaeraceae bacterium]|nr:xanthine dehydrogenase molybdopterin binding subunit [Tepidisphaeraceae bacterium]